MKEGAGLLSIVTVVRDDLEGLKATMASVATIPTPAEIEHVVVDGSSDDSVRRHLEAVSTPDRLANRSHDHLHLRWISEADDGIYDAMNKGLRLAQSRYVLFMNAGDAFSALFDWDRVAPYLQTDARVILGYCIERFGNDRYLRPGLGREPRAFAAPAHPATFYPRRFYSVEQYRLDLPVGSDGDYTRIALDTCGGVFVPVVVAEFALGGVSSTYGSLDVLKLRLAEVGFTRDRLKLVVKYVLWRVLPRRYFYRALAAYKYTRLRPNSLPTLLSEPIQRAAR